MAGKLSPDELRKYIFPYRGAVRSEVLTGPGVGEDAAVIENNGILWYISSDPIVGAVENIGSLLVDININDIAVKGGDPQYLMLTLLIPESMGLPYLEQIMKEIHEKALHYTIAIIGGHTEITAAYTKPVISATIIGSGSYRFSCDRVSLGDAVILIGDAALEGVHILHSHDPDRFATLLTAEEQHTLRSFKNTLCVYPYTCLIRDHVLFMHDPTEGGIIGGVSELANLLPDKGIHLSDEIHYRPIVQKITASVGARPGNLISSGALLALVAASSVHTVADILDSHSIPWQQIGTIAEANNFVPDTSEELWKFI